MNNKNKLKKTGFVLLLIVIMIPLAVSAEWNIDNVQVVAESAGLTTDKSFADIIGDAISWLMALLGSLSMLMFVVAGVMYVTANGEDDTIGKAKKLITYSITGMVIALSGFLIVEVVAAITGPCASFVCIMLDIFLPF